MSDDAPAHPMLRVEPDGIEIGPPSHPDVRLPFAWVTGVGVAQTEGGGTTLTLYEADGRAYRVASSGSTPAFEAAVARVVAELFALPELMRGMRAFGSSRGRPGSDHDRFFAPLVEPLRTLRADHARALGAGARATPWRAAECIGATRAGAEVRAALAALAAERFPASPPDRRALEAELLDESVELFDALDALTSSAQQLGVASERERVAAWREWSRMLAATLVAADRCWTRVVPALDEAPPPDSKGKRRAP